MRSWTMLVLLVFGCGTGEDEEVTTVAVEPDQDDEPAPSEAAEDEDVPEREPGELYSASRPLMGTVFVIRVDAPEDVAEPAVDRAFDEIERLETVLSEWRDDSEISRINQNAGIEPIQVSDDVYAVVKAGVDVSTWSGGAFDLSWAALKGLYDFRPGRQRIPERSAVRPRLRLIDYRQIELDDDAQTVFLRRRGMAIGTGGIGKGYALDRAGEILRNAGIESYMLFGGGQVQVHGMRGDRAWRVGIQHPRAEEEYFGFLESDGGSISTSGDYEHVYVDPNGKRWHHILDPRTGLPVERTMSVTFLAPSGLYADALSTATFVMGPRRARQMIENLPFRAHAVVVDAACKVTRVDTDDVLQMTVDLLPQDELPRCR